MMNKNVQKIQVESDKSDLKFEKVRIRLNKYYTICINLVSSFSIKNSLHFYITRLFSGDPVLGETVNAYVNENHKEIIDAFIPSLIEPFRALFNQVIGEILSDIPIDKFLRMKSL